MKKRHGSEILAYYTEENVVNAVADINNSMSKKKNSCSDI